MIRDDIINELQYIPEARLADVFDFIHSFRLKLAKETEELSLQEDDFKIDVPMCLKTLEKIKKGDFSGFTEIDDIDVHIQNLKNEIN